MSQVRAAIRKRSEICKYRSLDREIESVLCTKLPPNNGNRFIDSPDLVHEAADAPEAENPETRSPSVVMRTPAYQPEERPLFYHPSVRNGPASETVGAAGGNRRPHRAAARQITCNICLALQKAFDALQGTISRVR